MFSPGVKVTIECNYADWSDSGGVIMTAFQKWWRREICGVLLNSRNADW